MEAAVALFCIYLVNTFWWERREKNWSNGKSSSKRAYRTKKSRRKKKYSIMHVKHTHTTEGCINIWNFKMKTFLCFHWRKKNTWRRPRSIKKQRLLERSWNTVRKSWWLPTTATILTDKAYNRNRHAAGRTRRLCVTRGRTTIPANACA